MENSERRKHKRVNVSAGAFVGYKKTRLFNILEPDIIKLGPIIDISRGGLALEYIESKTRTKKFSEIVILTENDKIEFEDLPFITVSDNVIAELPGDKKIRKKCVQFGELSGYKIALLERFIKTIDLGLPQHVIEEYKTEKKAPKKRIKATSEKKEKGKFDIQSDILKKFRTSNLKAGFIISPIEWLDDVYIASLTSHEKEIFDVAVHELVLQGLLEYSRTENDKLNFRLTDKGEELIYKEKE